MSDTDLASPSVTQSSAGAQPWAKTGNGNGVMSPQYGTTTKSRSPVLPSKPSAPTAALGEGERAFAEEIGDPPMGQMPAIIGSESSSGHEEVGADAAESGEEYLEATPEQLSAAGAESGEESALSDLRGIEGYQDPSSMGEGAPISDAGSAGEGGEEFLPILGALVPTLVSTVGPALAKAVASKLKPATKPAWRPSPTRQGLS